MGDVGGVDGEDLFCSSCRAQLHKGRVLTLTLRSEGAIDPVRAYRHRRFVLPLRFAAIAMAMATARLTIPQRIWRTLVLIYELIVIAIPKDCYRVLTLRKKSVVDKVVVITGGGMGIGQRMAELFAVRERAKVVILDINEVEASLTSINASYHV